jgi:hypothetical protein
MSAGTRTRRMAGVKGLVSQYDKTDIRKHSFVVRTEENWNSLPDSIKTEVRVGNIQAETEAIESLAGRDRVGDSNSDSETGLDIKKAKRTKMLHILRECLTENI